MFLYFPSPVLPLTMIERSLSDHQEVTVKELLANSGRLGPALRKTTSVPNINQVGSADGAVETSPMVAVE